MEEQGNPSTPTRRQVLAGAAGVAAAMVIPAPVAHAATRVPVVREDQRVVIIGSGFGGGVAALRFAQAGVRVVVLERGIRWPTGPNSSTFPTMANLDKRALWHESAPMLFGKPLLTEKYTGLLETVAGKNMTAMCAAGVGGGSLVYQGMSLQPAQHVFEHWFPNKLDWNRMDRIHYPRVASMLKLAVAPDELVKSKTYAAARIFARNAVKAGYTVEKIPMPIDWSYALRELKGEMKPAYTNGDSALGVNNGGKHSVDVTYMKAAEATGLVDLRVRHQVTDIARTPDGRWEVAVNHIATDGRVMERHLIRTKTLIMAAGSVNTTKLLVRAKATGQIPDLPDALGTGWGTNGDRIYMWTNFADDFGKPQGGPVVYGSKEWRNPELANTVIQASWPMADMNIRSTMMVGFGVSDGRGSLTYNSKDDSVDLNWDKNADRKIWDQIGKRAIKIAGPWSHLSDTNLLMNSTWHPLGGAAMGAVCDLEGRVLGQRGLYVLDGALIPGTTAACNPSMTIAAIAERAMDEIVANDLGTII